MKNTQNIKYNPITQELSVLNPSEKQTPEIMLIHLTEIKSKMGINNAIEYRMEGNTLYIRGVSQGEFIELIQTLTRDSLATRMSSL